MTKTYRMVGSLFCFLMALALFVDSAMQVKADPPACPDRMIDSESYSSCDLERSCSGGNAQVCDGHFMEVTSVQLTPGLCMDVACSRWKCKSAKKECSTRYQCIVDMQNVCVRDDARMENYKQWRIEEESCEGPLE